MRYLIEFISKDGGLKMTDHKEDLKEAEEVFESYKKDDYKVIRIYDNDKIIKEIDMFNRAWIYHRGIPIVKGYEDELTLRALHYQLVAIGMFNTIRHYKRVVKAMIDARWDDKVSFISFKDHDRETLGATDSETTTVDGKVDNGTWGIDYYMNQYSKNRWENQRYYPEVFIEKKALQGVFEPVCNEWDVALNPCKGYPSLTFLYDAKQRFNDAILNGKTPVILYFGDYDPSGEDIPRSIEENLSRMGVEVEVRRIALMKNQVIDWKLPPAPAKKTDSRTATWDGLGQVELDAVEPRKLKELCVNSIKSVFDNELHDELLKTQEVEKVEYQKRLKEYVSKL